MGAPTKIERSKRNARIIEAYVAGEVSSVIADRFGMGRSTVETIVRDAGVNRKRCELVSEFPGLAERFFALRDEGLTLKAATAKVNAEFGTAFAASTLREHVIKQARTEDSTSEPAVSYAPELKSEVVFDGMVIRKMWVNGISLPAVGMAGPVAA
jgi:transposase